jgi:hypothetical protein
MYKYLSCLTLFTGILAAQEIPIQEHIKHLYAVAQKQAQTVEAEDLARIAYQHPFATVACAALVMRIPGKLLLAPAKTVGNPAFVSLVINGLVVKAFAHAYLKYKNIPHSHEGNFVNYTHFLNTHHCVCTNDLNSLKSSSESSISESAVADSKLQN